MNQPDIQRRATDMLARFYGYHSFRPGQLEIITAVMQGRDCTVLMPTGGGKSLCYQLPAIMLDGCAIVVSPLIALMKDQVNALISNGIPAAALNSNMSDDEVRTVLSHVNAGHIKLLYMSPERLLIDMERWSSDFKISLFAIDEAHCISQWGHDFRPVYTDLAKIKEKYPDTPVMALTATADRVTRDDIARQLRLRDPYSYIGSFDRPNISLRVVMDSSKTQRINTIASLIGRYPTDSGVVYCLSRKTAEEVTLDLQLRGFKAVCYHAGLSAAQRSKAQDEFISGNAQVVCATVAFGMGIDKSNIRWVVHYNMPANIESYYQEIGRAGRDGLPAEAVMFYSYQDFVMRRKFADESGQVSMNLEKLERLKEFAETTQCRRRVLLSYFNEETHTDCHNCDVCINPPERFDGTELAQKVMSAILRTGSDIGQYMTIDILRGSAKADIVSKGYNLIKTYGAGRDLSTQHWHYYMLQMLQLGIIDIDYDRGKKLSVTPYGMQVLKGQAQALLTRYEPATPKGKTKTTRRAVEKARDQRIFEALKEVRRREAVAIGIPPYLIFSDASLRDMALREPLTYDDFALVSGVGEKKLARYWKPFVNAVRRFNGMKEV